MERPIPFASNSNPDIGMAFLYYPAKPSAPFFIKTGKNAAKVIQQDELEHWMEFLKRKLP